MDNNDVQLMPEADEELLRKVWDELDDLPEMEIFKALHRLVEAAPEFKVVISLVRGKDGLIHMDVTFIHKDFTGPALLELKHQETDYQGQVREIVERAGL